MWLDAYLWGWLIAATAALAFADTFQDSSETHPLARGARAVLAGALWPLLVVGVLEIGCVVYVAKRLRTEAGALPFESPVLVGAESRRQGHG